MSRSSRTTEILNEMSKGFEHFDSTFNYTYDEYNDYEMHSVAPSKALAKMWKYLHYLNHIFELMQEAMRDILVRIEQNEKDLDELLAYMHVPAKLQKKDDSHTYIKVENINRTEADGLNPKLIDVLQQLHILDTSELDSVLDNILKWTGMETQIAGSSDPSTDKCQEIGDISKYERIRIYWSSTLFSIPRTSNLLSTEIGADTSFVFPNITDDPVTPQTVHGEIGQTLVTLSDTLQKARLCYHTTSLFRFENDAGTGENNAWQRVTENGNVLQPGGRISFSSSWWEKGENPLYGKGWLHITEITGVNYGRKAVNKDLEACVTRAKAGNYIGFEDYYRNLKYAMSAGYRKEQVALLNVIETYKEELDNIIVPKPDTQDEVITAYDTLVLYRANLNKRGVN